MCVLREVTIESSNRMFVTCDFSSRVWYQVLGGLGECWCCLEIYSNLFAIILSLGVGSKIRLGLTWSSFRFCRATTSLLSLIYATTYLLSEPLFLLLVHFLI